MRIRAPHCLPLAFALLLAVVAAFAPLPAARAQVLLQLPEQSPRASVGLRIGLTDVTIRYHRPLVGGRKIWGGLVPYGEVWRAGANENTTIEFSDPVMIEGQKLARGKYGLHVLPTADSWTLIFSKFSDAWGSYSYDQKEDALRVTVKPQAAEMMEALVFEFDQVKQDSALLKLRWEKLAAPVRITATDEDSVIPNLRAQLRGLAQFFWAPLNEAAAYCLEHKTNLEEALGWIERSLTFEERYENLDTKAKLLLALNRPEEAKAVSERALQVGNVTQIYFHARGLQAQGKQAEAMELYRNVVAKRTPQQWAGFLAQARLLSAAGDYAGAVKEVKAALALLATAPETQRQAVQALITKLEANQDINK